MILNRQHIIGGTVLGWLCCLLSSLVHVLTSSPTCPLLARATMGSSMVSIILLLVAFVCFGVAVVAAYQLPRGAVTHRHTQKFLLLALLCAIVVIPVNGHDVSFYASAGSTVHHGINVYATSWTVTDHFSCPEAIGPVDGMMYGPLSVRLFELVTTIAPTPLIFLIVWKLIMVATLLFFVFLMKRIHRAITGREDADRLVWLIAVQPFLVWQWVGSGQFDGLWIVTTLLAILYALRQRWVWVIPLLVIGIWIKFLPLLIAPWFVLWWWQSLGMGKRKNQLIETGVGLLIGLLLTLLAWTGFWQGTRVFHALILQSKWAVNSLFSAVYYSFRPLFTTLFDANGHWFLTRLVHLVLLGGAVYFLVPLFCQIYQVFRRRLVWTPSDYLRAIFVSLLMYLMIWQKSFWPWYVSWVLPFGLLTYICQPTHRTLRRLLLWLSIAPLGFYIVWFTMLALLPNIDPTQTLWFNYSIVLGLWAYPFSLLWQWRKNHYSLNEDRNI